MRWIALVGLAFVGCFVNGNNHNNVLFSEQSVNVIAETRPIIINDFVFNAIDEDSIFTDESILLNATCCGTSQGLKYVILRGGKSFASQVTSANTIYDIRDDFVLTANFTMPANCVLLFNGGRLGGAYTLYGNNTRIQASLTQLFYKNISIGGTWIVPETYPEWFLSEKESDFSGYADELQVISKKLVLTGNYVSKGFSLNPYHELEVDGVLNLKSTIYLAGFSNVKGAGMIKVNRCFAFTCDCTKGIIRRLFVSGLRIVGNNKDDGGFCSIGSFGGNNEISFSTFSGLSFYKCRYAFKGYFGGNNIEAKYESCLTTADIVGDFNNFTIQGQAPTYDDNNTSAFIIDGSYNTLRGRLWDIGSGIHQNTFVHYSNTSRNNSTDMMTFVESTNDSNGVFLVGNGMKVKMIGERPPYTFTYSNVTPLNTVSEARVMKMDNPTWISFTRINGKTEGFVDIDFETNTYFTSAICMMFISPMYAFERVEMYLDGTLYQTRFGYGLSESITLGPTDWNTFYNKNIGTHIKLRCYVPENGVRIRGTEFYV